MNPAGHSETETSFVRAYTINTDFKHRQECPTCSQGAPTPPYFTGVSPTGVTTSPAFLCFQSRAGGDNRHTWHVMWRERGKKTSVYRLFNFSSNKSFACCLSLLLSLTAHVSQLTKLKRVSSGKQQTNNSLVAAVYFARFVKLRSSSSRLEVGGQLWLFPWVSVSINSHPIAI